MRLAHVRLSCLRGQRRTRRGALPPRLFPGLTRPVSAQTRAAVQLRRRRPDASRLLRRVATAAAAETDCPPAVGVAVGEAAGEKGGNVWYKVVCT